MFTIYSILLTVGIILMSPVFLIRRKKYAAGFWQRLGYLPDFKHDARPVIWLHCVSVGEVNAARSLVDGIRRDFPNFRLVVSTTTRTGQELAAAVFKDAADAVFYFPLDLKFAVNRALKVFRPGIVLLMETEIWFNFIREASRNGAFVAIVNGRLSEKSARQYSYIKNFMKRVLRRVDLALMQTEEDAKRLISLGIRTSKVKVTGNLKFDQRQAETDLTGELQARFKISEESPLIVAASTHAPEERLVLEAFRRVYKSSAGRLPRLLIAPRHPGRFNEIEALIAKSGFSFVRRSSPPAGTDELADVILLDSIGELRAVYPLAEIVFVGGSLIPHGGQSVLEPASAGRAIITGHHTSNFRAVVGTFVEHQALIQLQDMTESDLVSALAKTLGRLLDDRESRATLGKNAQTVMENNRGATYKTIEQLRTFLQVHEIK
ncbi:MAG: 3-deoxy-D-manno-octulosonic acid transferase [Acidobacteria bacterium]|nr:3-deoxy-D-manno-octulosonic acid transferase [Acidobacteriota bacterium]